MLDDPLCEEYYDELFEILDFTCKKDHAVSINQHVAMLKGKRAVLANLTGKSSEDVFQVVIINPLPEASETMEEWEAIQTGDIHG